MLVATPLYGPRAFMIFWSYHKSDVISKFHVNMWKSFIFLLVNIILNLQQVLDNVPYIFVESLQRFTTSVNIVSVISLSRLVIT